MTADNLAIIFGALWAVSEALSLIPSVKANGIFQAIRNGLGVITGKNVE